MKTRMLKMVILFVLALVVGQGQAEPMGTAFTYQGRLIDANDAADGEYDFEFKLYDDPCTGTQQGSTIYASEVYVIDGYFTVGLDFGGVFDGNDCWLEIGVRPGDMNDPNVYTTLEPRQEVTPTPYAMYAKTAGSDGGDNLGNHTATQNVRLNGYWLSSDGDSEGVYVDNNGNVGIGIEEPVEKLEVNGKVMADNIGSVFTRWGTSTPPLGCSLLYWGYGYGGFYSQTGGGEPIVIQTGDPGGMMNNNGSLFYPLHTSSGYTYMPPGITPACYVKAAVCYVDAPTTVIWGTHSAPAGWTVLYRGYAMSAHYTYYAPKATICVECEAFDQSANSGSNNYSLLYGAKVGVAAPGDGVLQSRCIKCAVIRKN